MAARPKHTASGPQEPGRKSPCLKTPVPYKCVSLDLGETTRALTSGGRLTRTSMRLLTIPVTVGKH